MITGIGITTLLQNLIQSRQVAMLGGGEQLFIELLLFLAGNQLGNNSSNRNLTMMMRFGRR